MTCYVMFRSGPPALHWRQRVSLETTVSDTISHVARHLRPSTDLLLLGIGDGAARQTFAAFGVRIYAMFTWCAYVLRASWLSFGTALAVEQAGVEHARDTTHGPVWYIGVWTFDVSQRR
jgi:hypothetical protein